MECKPPTVAREFIHSLPIYLAMSPSSEDPPCRGSPGTVSYHPRRLARGRGRRCLARFTGAGGLRCSPALREDALPPPSVCSGPPSLVLGPPAAAARLLGATAVPRSKSGFELLKPITRTSEPRRGESSP
jgi:hypothetical protein